MPKLACRCGHVLDLSPIPTHVEYAFFNTDRWKECIALLAAAARSEGDNAPLEEHLSDALAGFVDHFYRCPACGRLIVFWDGADGGEPFSADASLIHRRKVFPQQDDH